MASRKPKQPEQAELRPGYQVFLLRVWRANAGDTPAWRAALEDAHSGRRRGFSDLAGLIAFLDEQIDTDIHKEHPE